MDKVRSRVRNFNTKHYKLVTNLLWIAIYLLGLVAGQLGDNAEIWHSAIFIAVAFVVAGYFIGFIKHLREYKGN